MPIEKRQQHPGLPAIEIQGRQLFDVETFLNPKIGRPKRYLICRQRYSRRM
jgi:hypothetical protein